MLSLTRSFHLSVFTFYLSRYWVVTVSAPGMASEYSADGKVESLEGTVLAKRFHCILTTCGRESARRWSERRYACLIKSYRQYQYLTKSSEDWVHCCSCDCAIFPNRDIILAVMSCEGLCWSVSQMKAMSIPPEPVFPMEGSRCLFRRYASRNWRFTLLRSTAWRKRFLETETRMRNPASSVCLYTARMGYADRDLLSVPVKSVSIAFLLQSLSVFFRPKPLSIMLLQVCVQSCGDAGVFWCGSLKVESKTCIGNALGSSGAESGNHGLALLVVREVLQ